MAKEKESTKYYNTISRRRFAQIAGATGAAALAGCGGGDTTTEEDGAAPADTATDDDDSSDGYQVHDVTFNALNDTANTGDLHWNYINQSNYADWPRHTMTDRGMAFNYKKGEYVPYAFESWNISEDQIEINIRKELAWADGTDYTSQHAKEEIALSKIVGSSLWDYIESLDDIETPDDKTLIINLAKKANQDMLKHALGGFHTNLRAKEGTPYAKVYNEMVENGVDNVSDEALQSVSEWTPETPPMTCAPFVHSEQDANAILLERNPEHPDAENINFQKYQWGSSPGNQHKQAQLVSDKVDGVMSLFCPPRIAANMPDGIEEARPPALWGYGLMPNHDRPHVEHREVRQAIMYAVDRKTIIQNAGPRTKQAPKTPGGIPASQEETWLGDEIDSYMTYDETAKGEEVLQSANYSKDGGTWKDENGKPATLTLNVMAGWSDWVTATQTIVSQLSDFGFDARLNSVPGGSVWGEILPESKFQLQSFWWLAGAPQSAFPYYPLRHQYGYAWNATNPHNYPAWNDGDGQEITVPGMDGGEMTIDPVSEARELASMTDENAVTERVRKLQWVNNVDLPMLGISEKLDQSWYRNKGDWDAPDSDSTAAGIKWAPTWMPKQGQLRYVGDE